MVFQLQQKLMTLNDLKRGRNGGLLSVVLTIDVKNVQKKNKKNVKKRKKNVKNVIKIKKKRLKTLE